MIKKVNWDSDFFDLQIGELYIDNETNLVIDKDSFYDLIYIKSNKNFKLYSDLYKESLSEEIVLYFKKNKNSGFEIKNTNITQFNKLKHSILYLYELSYECGKYSRFKLDKKFKNKNFKKLYREWIDNSLNGKMANEVIIYEENNIPIAFITYKITDDTATYCLMAVSNEHQGKGIGKTLFEFVAQKLEKEGITKLLIPTQKSNEVACKLYNKLGYSIKETTYIKHYWRK